MLGAPRVTAVRLAVAAVLGVLPGALGCTSILGIDGTYIEGAGQGGKRTVGGDSGGEGGEGGVENRESGGTGAGGTVVRGGAGGTVEDGGTAGDPDASTRGGAGGTPVVTSCRAGKYAGAMKGTHSASFTFVGVPLTVSGPLSFELTGTGSVLHIANGKVNASIILLAGAPDALEATIDGTYDCSTHKITGHLSGKVNAGITSIDGTLTGDLMIVDLKDTERPWEESELSSSGAPTGYKGKGFWNAKYTGP